MADFLFINVNQDVGNESSESIPISLGYIAAALSEKGSRTVILDDLRDNPLSLKNLEKWIRRLPPSVVGFTAYQSTMQRIRFLARYIKSRHEHIRIMLGGPQVYAMPPQGLVELRDVDILVHGDGEAIAPEIAEKMDQGKSLDGLNGITFRKNEAVVETAPWFPHDDNLDRYPSPYLNSIVNLRGKDTAILLSSRGCRHVCRFCITPRLCGGRVRYHSIQRVVEEMEHLSGSGIQRFWFADPNFTDDPERTVSLLREKIHRGIHTPFWCQTRSDLVDRDMMKLLKEAGCDTIAFGLESGSPSVLKKTGKQIELDHLRENIVAAKSLEMDTELFSIFGLPGETVDDARKTMEFLRSLEIPIESNSGSQQMQLYFGSVFERNPEAFGIRPEQIHRPAYLSVGEQYETTEMNSADLVKVRNLWALANTQLETDVYYKQRTFEILQFLLDNRQDLEEEPSFHAFGALASAAIEEHSLLEQFLEGYDRLPPDNRTPTKDVIAAIPFFRESDEPVGGFDRVIFDSRSYIGGIPFTGISGKYWDVLLGHGLLLPDFEAGFLGAHAGDNVKFTFVFPEDYMQEELRGQEVEVHAKIHKVFKCIELNSLNELREARFDNRYDFSDLDLLRDQNDILYYLALRDADPVSLLKTPSHFLTRVHRLAKLNKNEDIQRLAELLHGKPTALNALAETLVACGRYRWALPFYETLSTALPSAAIKQVKCLLRMGEYQRAAELLKTIPESTDYEYQETLLLCLKAVDGHSPTISDLEHHCLDLRVREAIQREAYARPNQLASKPTVHGLTEEDSGDSVR